MSKPRVRTVPNFADTSPAHQATLVVGKEHFRSWEYNVEDRFKEMATEEVKEVLRKTANPFAVLFEHVLHDFNMSTGIRNANAFNAKEVFYLGDKKYDRRGCCGTNHYHEPQWLPTLDALLALKDRYTFVGVDNVPGAVPIETYVWKPMSLMCFGEEGCGLTTKMQSLCKDIVSITQHGSVRSLNVGTASGIVMYDFMSKLKAP